MTVPHCTCESLCHPVHDQTGTFEQVHIVLLCHWATLYSGCALLLLLSLLDLVHLLLELVHVQTAAAVALRGGFLEGIELIAFWVF